MSPKIEGTGGIVFYVTTICEVETFFFFNYFFFCLFLYVLAINNRTRDSNYYSERKFSIVSFARTRKTLNLFHFKKTDFMKK